MVHIRRTLAATLIALTAATFGASAETAIATFAGGCFWCVESDFDHVPGVVGTVSGYTGGTSQNPNYNDHSGHREAVRITYDPAKVTYQHLLHVFWRSIDPTDKHGQFCDRATATRRRSMPTATNSWPRRRLRRRTWKKRANSRARLPPRSRRRERSGRPRTTIRTITPRTPIAIITIASPADATIGSSRSGATRPMMVSRNTDSAT